MAGWYTIPGDVRAALTEHATYTGPRVTITAQLDSPVWQRVRTVLEKAGAVFVVGTSSFDFDAGQDAGQIVAAVLAAGRVMSAVASHGWVPTPEDLATDLVEEYAEIGGRPWNNTRLEVLEPSAGTGSLVDAVLYGALYDPDRCAAIADWMHVTAVEVDPRRARQIPASAAVTVAVGTFEEFAAQALADGRFFDRIVMNPPFSVPGQATIWATHLLLAWRLLAPGGRLMAILPTSVLNTHPQSRFVDEAAALVRRYGAGERLDGDAFEASGIKAATAVVWLDQPIWVVEETTPGSGGSLPAFVCRPYTGDEAPVRVDRIQVSRAAAAAMPVQIWRDGWRNTDRVLRYRAECAVCGRLVWGFDDGENDPRGVLGDNAPDLVDPADHDLVGLPVALCFGCGNTHEAYDKGKAAAVTYWSGPRVVDVLDDVATGRVSAEVAGDEFARRTWPLPVPATPGEAWGVVDDPAPVEESWTLVNVDSRLSPDSYRVLAGGYRKARKVPVPRREDDGEQLLLPL